MNDTRSIDMSASDPDAAMYLWMALRRERLHLPPIDAPLSTFNATERAALDRVMERFARNVGWGDW